MIFSPLQGRHIRDPNESPDLRVRRFRDLLHNGLPGRPNESPDRRGGPERGRTRLRRVPRGRGQDARVESLVHPLLLHALHTRHKQSGESSGRSPPPSPLPGDDHHETPDFSSPGSRR